MFSIQFKYFIFSVLNICTLIQDRPKIINNLSIMYASYPKICLLSCLITDGEFLSGV